MKFKRVLLTGGSGFVGRRLIDALPAAGYAVRAVTRRRIAFPPAVESVLVSDLKNRIDWAPILDGIDIVIHLAGVAHGYVANDQYSDFDHINWLATQRLAEAASKAGIERFIYLSSVRAQTGASATHLVSEKDEPRPTNYYGRSKLAAEHAIRAAGVPFTIFRPVVIYGPDPKGNMLSLMRLAQSHLPLPFASFKSRRSVLGIDNLISAVLFALDNAATINETYLLADPKPMTVGEILKTLRKSAGQSINSINVPPSIMRLLFKVSGRRDLWERFNQDLVVDTSKLETLGWRAVKNTAEGLAAMIRAGREKNAQFKRQVL